MTRRENREPRAENNVFSLCAPQTQQHRPRRLNPQRLNPRRLNPRRLNPRRLNPRRRLGRQS